MAEFVITNAPKEFDIFTSSVLVDSTTSKCRLLHVSEPGQLTKYSDAGYYYEHVSIGEIFSYKISMSLMAEALKQALETIDDLKNDLYWSENYPHW